MGEEKKGSRRKDERRGKEGNVRRILCGEKRNFSSALENKFNEGMNFSGSFHSTCTISEATQRTLAWLLPKDDMKIHESFHIFN